MDSPRGRPGRTPVSVKPIAAAHGRRAHGHGRCGARRPEGRIRARRRRGSGPAPQAQANGSAPAQGGALRRAGARTRPALRRGTVPAPKTQRARRRLPQAKAKGHRSPPSCRRPSRPRAVRSDPALSRRAARQQRSPSRTAGPRRGPRAGTQAAATPVGRHAEALCPSRTRARARTQPLPVGGQEGPTGGATPGGSEGLGPHRGRAEQRPRRWWVGSSRDGIRVLGANQGGERTRRSRLTPAASTPPLPFTGFEVVLLAGDRSAALAGGRAAAPLDRLTSGEPHARGRPSAPPRTLGWALSLSFAMERTPGASAGGVASPRTPRALRARAAPRPSCAGSRRARAGARGGRRPAAARRARSGAARPRGRSCR